MMNKNFNNGAANNNSNNGTGEFIMATNTIKTMEAFADTIKMAMEVNFGNGVRVTVQKVTKTNGVVLTGLTIMDKTSNLAPTIYLEPYFNDYNCGEPMGGICKRILKVYEENKVTDAKTETPVPYGTYTVKETVFPKNYHAYGKTEWTVTVGKGNNGLATVNAVNEADNGSAKIVKTSEDFGRETGIPS